MINLRSQDIANLSSTEFHIVGCGAIGSSVATQLTRLGADNFFLYDFDKVEIQNVGVSQYVDSDVGLLKVIALGDHMTDINLNIRIESVADKFEYYKGTKEGILILGLDSMSARMEIVKLLAECPTKPAFVIDGRMGAEQYQQYIYDNITVKKYEKDWYSDEDSDPEPCTRKATSYCSNMSGSFISNSIKNLVMKQPYFKEIIFNFSTLILDKKKLIS
jgi:molybdopterin/thiamine biosynthesis adenylyltransferase